LNTRVKVAARVFGALAAISMLAVGTAATSGATTSVAPTTASVAPVAVAPGSPAAFNQVMAVKSRPGGRATAADTIVCTPTVQNPHKSTHVPGTVNVVVTLSCTQPVPGINIRAALYLNGLLVKDSGQKTVNNSAFAQHNAAVPCQSGTYQGWMSYGVLFPPGYVPPTGASSGFGNVVSITC